MMNDDLLRKRQLRAAEAANARPLPERFKRRIEEAEKRKAAKLAAAIAAEQERQRAELQRQRDRQLQEYEQANAAQRAMFSANAAENQYGYSSRLADQQQKGQLKRDSLQNRFDEARARQQTRDQEMRDLRQFELAQKENATQFQNQMQRDAVQQGYTKERDQLQNAATRDRDYLQFGFSTLRDDQQQQNTLQRDAFQQRQQLERDRILNQFSVQDDERRQRNTLERDAIQNQFATEADARQQGYTRQNMYQREAADISARWQEQIAQARNAGLDFSDRQRKEMQEMDEAFRKNVLNGPWDEDMKQQAMVEYQKKLSAIIPNEKIQDPMQVLQQSVMFDERNGTWFRQSRDARGFPTFDPISGGSGQGEDKQAQAEQKLAEQQQQKIHKAEMDRLDRFNDLVDSLATEVDPVTGEPVYRNRADVMNEAMKRFDPYEKLWRKIGLPPMSVYQQEADAIRSQSQQAGPPPRGGMADSLAARSGDVSPPPVIMSGKNPIPAPVAEKLKAIPGGDQLIQIREKHKSNSKIDQGIRLATDIYINALMTGDTSDPDFAEAQDILQRAGFRTGP